MKRLVEGFVMLCLVPVWAVLLVAYWIGHEMFGDYEDWDDRE